MMPLKVGRGASRGARSRRHREVETTTLGQSTIYAVPYPWVSYNNTYGVGADTYVIRQGGNIGVRHVKTTPKQEKKKAWNSNDGGFSAHKQGAGYET